MTVCRYAVPISGRSALAALTGASRCRLGVVPALQPTHVAPAAAVGDVGELGDVDVDQRAGVVVLVAAQGFAGDPVDPGEPVDPAPHQHGVHRGSRDPEPAADLYRPEPVPPPQPDD